MRPYHDLIAFPAEMTLYQLLKQTCFDKYTCNVPYRFRYPWHDDEWNMVLLRPETAAELEQIRRSHKLPLRKVPRELAERAIFLAVCRRWAWETG